MPGGTEGDPVYVGFGRPAAMFSNLGLAVVVKPDALDLRDIIPDHWFVYIAIFAFCGAALAHMLDRRDRGQFWRMQTLVLRLVTWPALLISAGNVALDDALANATPNVVNMISQSVHALWWIIPARLAVIFVERFVWVPLENRAHRKVPTVFRIIVALVIYAGAMLGILAFVLERTITSLLASTGLLAMIIGLAIQSNLKDIFSGIMLNLERPFSINDYVRINRTTIGRVIDVTWRTTRLETREGVLALPNGKMSDAEIENLSRGDGFRVESPLLVDPRHPPELLAAVVDRVMPKVRNPPWKRYKLKFIGVQSSDGVWVAHYIVEIIVPEWEMTRNMPTALWRQLWGELQAAGIEWIEPLPAEPSDIGPPALPGVAVAGITSAAD
jgi:branched-chain amino acid transport system substrate-binding protein